jgi:hypothetical protein
MNIEFCEHGIGVQPLSSRLYSERPPAIISVEYDRTAASEKVSSSDLRDVRRLKKCGRYQASGSFGNLNLHVTVSAHRSVLAESGISQASEQGGSLFAENLRTGASAALVFDDHLVSIDQQHDLVAQRRDS